ncbi:MULTISPECIES: threonine/serine exporter family protein [Paenibacillus]|uniref:threonine/serine exporter family protein n=1 Tax=Paenibacillus TaxID=44249 RepID=UPI000FDABE95|nr:MULTISPECIES: threonine/serine exporter family protein [Paenibacillus]MCK9857867.1 threonine/serine exporter family protein [Paenibacillus sp. ATY16]
MSGVLWIEQAVTSFIASAAFGLIFNAPRQMLPQCGVVGMVGWLLYRSCTEMGLEAIPSTLIAVIIVAVISQLFAKLYKTPIIVFSVAGIIPLVPGGIAYDAMRRVVENDYDVAVQLGVKAFMISGTIAIGLVLSEVVNQTIRRMERL